MLNQIFKLDSVMITKKEIVSAIVFYDYFGEKKIAMNSVSKLQTRWTERQNKRKGEKAKPDLGSPSPSGKDKEKDKWAK